MIRKVLKDMKTREEPVFQALDVSAHVRNALEVVIHDRFRTSGSVSSHILNLFSFFKAQLVFVIPYRTPLS